MALRPLSLGQNEKEEEDDEFDGCLGYENDKIWIYSVDLIREGHVRVKDEAKLASRGTS